MIFPPTWTRLKGNGLPTKPVGKVAVAIANSNSQRVYAMIETGDGIPWNGEPTESGQLWRSEDGGRQWALISRDRNVMGRAHYYSRMAVATDDEDETYFLTASFGKTIDGGLTLNVVPRAQAPGGDHHDMWIDPTDADRMIVGHDQGVSISINRCLASAWVDDERMTRITSSTQRRSRGLPQRCADCARRSTA